MPALQFHWLLVYSLFSLVICSIGCGFIAYCFCLSRWLSTECVSSDTAYGSTSVRKGRSFINCCLCAFAAHTDLALFVILSSAMAAVINSVVNPVLYNPNVKDSRWLTLDVCREYTRNKCTRTEDECRFAHPPPNVEVQNGRVMCCFDSIKVRSSFFFFWSDSACHQVLAFLALGS